MDGKLVNSETFKTIQESFIYEFTPDGDQTKIKFKLVDANNNAKHEEVLISNQANEKDLTNLLNSLNQ